MLEIPKGRQKQGIDLQPFQILEKRGTCFASGWEQARLMKIIVVSLLDRLMIATTTTHNQTNQMFGQKLMNLALMQEAKSFRPILHDRHSPILKLPKFVFL